MSAQSAVTKFIYINSTQKTAERFGALPTDKQKLNTLNN